MVGQHHSGIDLLVLEAVLTRLVELGIGFGTYSSISPVSSLRQADGVETEPE